jgi:FixJ family two-component response regulator
MVVQLDIAGAITSNIKILQGELKSEKELIEILKKRLTKKEYKVFCAIESGIEESKVADMVNMDSQGVDETYQTVIKKLNQEKLKYELTIL